MVTLIFNGSEGSDTENTELKLYANVDNDIYIEIGQPWKHSSFICLDRSTAIKLHRELKKQISFLNED